MQRWVTRALFDGQLLERDQKIELLVARHPTQFCSALSIAQQQGWSALCDACRAAITRPQRDAAVKAEVLGLDHSE